jgi:glutamate dehydrogenase
VSLSATGSATPGSKPASAETVAANETTLTSALFDSALPGELENLDAAGRAAIARFVCAAAAKRLPGMRVIHLNTAEVDDSAPGSAVRRRRMALAIIGEDRPFLVDSTSATITAARLDIDRLLHPVIDVCRDADGALIEVIGLANG